MDRYEFKESDWKLFRKKIVDWQENYMDRLAKEYIELLSSDLDASERFWTLEERIKKDKKKAGVQLEMSRSGMELNIMSLLHDGAICIKDLEGFSEGLQEYMIEYCKRTRIK